MPRLLAPSGAPSPRRRTARLAALPAVLALVVAGLGAVPTAAVAADAAPYAAVDTPGPVLSPSPAALDAALVCSGDPATGPTPVLLVPATGVTPTQNYGWNYLPALQAAGIATCTIELPQSSLGDVQVAGEYVVHAIRELHRRAGRRISVIGHSQGGMVFRWALRFWPDTRAMVDDVIGFAGSNHGTTVLDALPTCRVLGCPVASLQQAAGARFIAALNSGQETFAGISYTNIRTTYDQVVTPSAVPDDQASSSLTTGDGRITNVAVQAVCPTDVSEHLLVGTTSGTSYALAMDALTHDGPADPRRISPLVCAQPLMPGVDPLALQANLAALGAAPGLLSVVGVNLAGVPVATEEPPLAAYVFAGGSGSPVDPGNPGSPGTAGGAGQSPAAASQPRLRVTPGRVRVGRTTLLRIRVTTAAGSPLRGERVRVLGRTTRTDARGRATVRVRPTRVGVRTARATGNGLPAATDRVRVLRRR